MWVSLYPCGCKVLLYLYGDWCGLHCICVNVDAWCYYTCVDVDMILEVLLPPEPLGAIFVRTDELLLVVNFVARQFLLRVKHLTTRGASVHYLHLVDKT